AQDSPHAVCQLKRDQTLLESGRHKPRDLQPRYRPAWIDVGRVALAPSVEVPRTCDRGDSKPDYCRPVELRSRLGRLYKATDDAPRVRRFDLDEHLGSGGEAYRVYGDDVSKGSAQTFN